MSTKQLKDGSSFKANCAICDKERYFDGLVGGECVCNKCYKPFFYGIMKERKVWEEREVAKKWENMADEINDACNPLWNQINELQQKLKEIHQLILEAKEESLLLPTQYQCKYKDGTDGVKWTMINKATKILSDIREIINV